MTSDDPKTSEEDARSSRTAPWWDAGGTTFTAAYWGAVAVFVAALFRTRLLPFVDYPQHLALAATLRRMMGSGAPERALFETNLLSYNSSFHVLVAGLATVVSVETAGRLAVAGSMVLTAAATLALLGATGRPRARAFLFLPMLVGYTLAWGFVNFGMGAAIQLFVLARVLRKEAPPDEVASEADDTGWRARYGDDLITAALAALGAWSHLLASALVYMLMLVVIVVRVQTGRTSLAHRLGLAIRTGLPLLPAIGYCYLVYRRQQQLAWQNFEYGAYEGNDVFGMVKIRGFLDYAAGLRGDRLDAHVLSISLGLLLLAALFRDPDAEHTSARGPRALPYLFFASLLAYLVIPHVFWATNFVFERLTFFIVLMAVLWTPRAEARKEEVLQMMGIAVGLGAALSFWGFMGLVRDEVRDLDTILDVMPKGRRVTGLVFHPRLESDHGPAGQTPVTAQWALVHSPAYYVARNGGEVAFSFTRTMSLPVHYKRETLPADPPPNFEWNPQDYRWDAAYARYFDLVLMKTTHDDGVDPRASVWGFRAEYVDVLAHHGRWWVLDTRRLSSLPKTVIDPLRELGVEGIDDPDAAEPKDDAPHEVVPGLRR